MKYFGKELSQMHKELNKIIRKSDEIENAKNMFLELHAKLHVSSITNSEPNEVDILFNDLKPSEYRIMPTKNDETIAWVLWHIARIEDITMNILVAKKNQVFNKEWKDIMNTPISDTGNALLDDEIMQLSKDLNIDGLLSYRNAVGIQTREIVNHLLAEDMLQKVSFDDIEKIRLEGGVTDQTDSIWLLDYWSKKDTAGLLLMPPTRHVIMHLNDCCKWKHYIRANKKCFLTI